jgi:integrase
MRKPLVKRSGNPKQLPKNGLKGAVQQKRAFTPAEVAQIEDLLLRLDTLIALRDRCLFRLGVDTMLRSSDLLRVTVGDVKPGPRSAVVESFVIRQKKTGMVTKCNLTTKAQGLVEAWTAAGWDGYCREDRLFDISDRQYRRIVKRLAEMIKLDAAHYSTHSVRRTRSKAIYAATKNLGAVRVLLGQSSLGATAAYLGIDQEDASAVARSVDI